MRRTMLRWSKSAIGIRPDVNSMFDLGRREKEQTLLFEAHLRALSEYRPVPTQVPITLFRASQQLLSHLVMDRTLGWSELAESPVSVRIIPGSHGTILTEPSVRQLAKILSDELDAAQGVPRGRPRPCGHLPKP
jgi:thioesterase domain-containing protein